MPKSGDPASLVVVDEQNKQWTFKEGGPLEFPIGKYTLVPLP